MPSMNGGSFFLAEINRTMSSSSPGGAASDSTGVTKPYGYARLVNSSMVFAVSVIFAQLLFVGLYVQPTPIAIRQFNPDTVDPPSVERML